jgi:ABC-type glycerol-3-phosphate transport system substrate-binding protein
MKTYSKWITFVISVLIIMSLVGCAPQGGQETTVPEVEETTAPEPEATEATEPEATEATEPEATEAMETEPPAAGEPITLRYANWNLGTEEENNINRRLVQAYMDANPHVTVEVVDMSGEGGWEANLTAYAAKGELPDVIMANNVPLYVQNGWVADLTDMVANDADYADVPQILRDSFTYDGRVLGLPFAQFIMGYFVNQDLFEAANLDAPEYGFTVEEFREAVTSLTDIEQGVLGADEIFPIMGWYPNTVDPNLKWYSYDGEGMNYNSAAFKEGVAFTEEMKPYTWQGLTEEQKANFISVGPWELFLNQEVGLKWDASWAVPAWVQNATFEWDFIGFPGGNQAIVFDAIVVSATTANLQESYNFAKWMTFSKEAYMKEAELARELNLAPKIPVSLDDESIALYKEFVDIPGVNTALENLDASVIESMPKIVPGYINARWEGKPGIDIGENMDVTIGFIFDNVTNGLFKYEDFSAQLEEFANNIMANAKAEMNQ